MTSDPYADLRRAMKKRRNTLGLSQQELAQRMGYTNRTSVSTLEALNSYPPTPAMIARWGRALLCDVTVTITVSFPHDFGAAPVNIDVPLTPTGDAPPTSAHPSDHSGRLL
jgi:transcriptional regulator with XRE-family HTH domain